MSEPLSLRSANDNVIKALARVLVEARAGNIEAVAIVAVTADGVPDASFGGEAELMPSTYLGLEMLKLQILDRTTATQAVPVSKIRPAAGSN